MERNRGDGDRWRQRTVAYDGTGQRLRGPADIVPEVNQDPTSAAAIAEAVRMLLAPVARVAQARP